MKNVGSTDKIIRIVLAIILFSLFFILQGNLRFIAILGFVPLITAIVGFCPIYTLLGISTGKAKK
jgi:hypothetical protein